MMIRSVLITDIQVVRYDIDIGRELVRFQICHRTAGGLMVLMIWLRKLRKEISEKSKWSFWNPDGVLAGGEPLWSCVDE